MKYKSGYRGSRTRSDKAAFRKWFIVPAVHFRYVRWCAVIGAVCRTGRRMLLLSIGL